MEDFILFACLYLSLIWGFSFFFTQDYNRKLATDWNEEVLIRSSSSLGPNA